MIPRPYYSRVLVLSGLILIGMGLYFVLLRPALLPEDVRYIGTNMAEIQATIPGLLDWLEKVFWMMGGHILTVGLLTLYVSLTSFRSRTKGVCGAVTLAGLASMGWMAAVNFIFDSDYQWLLLAFAALWGAALAPFWLEGGSERRTVDV
jgi:hypothetical protein